MSQSQANEVIRVLSGTPLKFTNVVHRPDGSRVEFQSNVKPQVVWNDQARSLWLMRNENYENYPIMQWETGSVLLTELNPAAADAPK